MKFLINQLFDFIDAPIPSNSELINLFTQMAYEVENIESAFITKGVKIGRTIKCVQHPNADKISFCQVETDGTTYDVVCGGKNIKTDQTVIHAIPGSFVGDVQLQPKELRGIVSNGMVLSISEIGGFDKSLVEDENINNIVILDDSKLGGSAEQAVFMDTDIFDLLILPDRTYANSYIMMAKELAAFMKVEFAPPSLTPETNFELVESATKNEATLKINSIDGGQTCPKVKALLYHSSIKPTNTINDVIEYVNLITGVVVNVEQDIVTLTINDGKGSLAYNLNLAVQIFINASKHSNFISEASDVVINVIKNIREITINQKYISNYIGQEINIDDAFDILNRLDFKLKSNIVEIPSYREDVVTQQDFIEEFVRVYGIENIIPKELKTINKKAPVELHKKHLKEIVEELTKFGFHEVKTYQLVTSEEADKYNINDIKERIKLKENYSFKYNTVQTSLLKGLIDVHSHNYHKDIEDIRIFELSNIFYEGKPIYSLGILNDTKINEEEPILATKAIVEKTLISINVNLSQIEFEDKKNDLLNPYIASVIKYKGDEIGVIGEIHPKILREFKYIRLDKIKEKLFYSEIRIEDIN